MLHVFFLQKKNGVERCFWESQTRQQIWSSESYVVNFQLGGHLWPQGPKGSRAPSLSRLVRWSTPWDSQRGVTWGATLKPLLFGSIKPLVFRFSSGIFCELKTKKTGWVFPDHQFLSIYIYIDDLPTCQSGFCMVFGQNPPRCDRGLKFPKAWRVHPDFFFRPTSSTSEKGCAVILGWKETAFFWDFLEAASDVAFCEPEHTILRNLTKIIFANLFFMSLIFCVSRDLEVQFQSSRGLPAFFEEKNGPRSSNLTPKMMCHIATSLGRPWGRSTFWCWQILTKKIFITPGPAIAFQQTLAGEALPPGPSWPQNPPKKIASNLFQQEKTVQFSRDLFFQTVI